MGLEGPKPIGNSEQITQAAGVTLPVQKEKSPVSKVGESVIESSNQSREPVAEPKARSVTPKSDTGIFSWFLRKIRGFTSVEAAQFSGIKEAFSKAETLIKQSHEGVKNENEATEKYAKSTSTQTALEGRAHMQEQLLKHIDLIDGQLKRLNGSELNLKELAQQDPSSCKNFELHLQELEAKRDDLNQLYEIQGKLGQLEKNIENYDVANHEDFLAIKKTLTETVDMIKGRSAESPKVQNDPKLLALTKKDKLKIGEAYTLVKAAHPEIASYFKRLDSQIAGIREEKTKNLDKRAERVLGLESKIIRVIGDTQKTQSAEKKEAGREELKRLFSEVEKLRDFDPAELKWMEGAAKNTPAFSKAAKRIAEAGETLRTLKAEQEVVEPLRSLETKYAEIKSLENIRNRSPEQQTTLDELLLTVRSDFATIAKTIYRVSNENIPENHLLITGAGVPINREEVNFRISKSIPLFLDQINNLSSTSDIILREEMSRLKTEFIRNKARA